MKYNNFIKRILESRENVKQEGVYMERHHVIPKCMGGTNDPENLVWLTDREHLIAHKMLYRENKSNYKLAFAYHQIYKTLRGKRKGYNKDLKKVREIWYETMNGENDPRIKSVICLEDKKVFRSLKEAAIHYSTSLKNISRVCRDDRRTFNGMHFDFYDSSKYTDDYIESEIARRIERKRLAKIPSKETMEKCRLAKIGKKRPDISGVNASNAVKVLCVETGEVFDTLKQASTHLKLKSSMGICDCIHGKQKTAGGYHWKKYEDVA